MKIPTIPTLQEMLEAGFHLGHKKQYSDARGRDYFYEVREKVVVINLDKTQENLKKALEFIANEASKGAKFMFVGTKPQVKKVVAEAAKYADMPYINNRWLGGTLTNFETIEKNLKKLKSMQDRLAKEDQEKTLTKKEKLDLSRSIDRLKFTMEGIVSLCSLPDVLIVVDPHKEKAAVREAFATGVPIVAILDTDSNPKGIEFPVPANDDSTKAVKIIMDLFASAIKDNFVAKTDKVTKIEK